MLLGRAGVSTSGLQTRGRRQPRPRRATGLWRGGRAGLAASCQPPPAARREDEAEWGLLQRAPGQGCRPWATVGASSRRARAASAGPPMSGAGPRVSQPKPLGAGLWKAASADRQPCEVASRWSAETAGCREQAAGRTRALRRARPLECRACGSWSPSSPSRRSGQWRARPSSSSEER